ncbi:hypothetical protein [Pseudoalteromonas sp. S16_S37]|uniref:hypothetical protein n=1 Tax=Pseudoalteromonas sp. S16_S37 TaxID=2720228 RepID=UPI001680011C|nr:hypothetical protein [Pseudoalteromonas sp. S16_S37]MBD1584651.1 hypothetical protein [Pseudoalteromonas sp. S16_S37]
MTLIQKVKNALVRLCTADRGWLELFNHHGAQFDLSTLEQLSDNDLKNKLLNQTLNIDTLMPGFGDFHPQGKHLITPAKPAESLLYHALASANVLTKPDGFELQAFPSRLEIEAVENFVFAAEEATLDSIVQHARSVMGFPDNTEIEIAICSFSAEYRVAQATVHGTHADMCFSRTGIARVGTQAAVYSPQLRGYSVFEQGDDSHQIRVLPCHFSPYIAARFKGRQDRFGPVAAFNDRVNDSHNEFWVPLHKLFSGNECIHGMTLNVEQHVSLYNQKLEKFAQLLNREGFSDVQPAELEQAPYRVTDLLANWGDVDSFGNGVLVPVAHPLVSAASNDDGLVAFEAPKMTSGGIFYDSFAPSLAMQSDGGARPWPEYAHVREQVNSDGSVTSLTDNPDVIDITKQGGYQALHYLDYAADGFVTPKVTTGTGAPLSFAGSVLESVSAYSLVSAPDFFPKVRQRFVYSWWKNDIPNLASSGKLPQWWQWLVDNGYWDNVWRAEPLPLSDIRVAANLQLPDSPFAPEDKTVSAIVCIPQLQVTEVNANSDIKKMAHPKRNTYLPDGAAGIFAPGWDTSFDKLTNAQGSVNHLAAYGLGSPFPEDAKLCAALSTFWPAAAPDTTRTFFSVPFSAGSVVPLTDDESGTGQGASWDGLKGPHYVDRNAEHSIVQYPDYPRADYTRNALDGLFSIEQTSKITLEEYKRRIVVMLRAYRAIDMLDSKNSAHIVSFKQVNLGIEELEQAQERTGVELSGPIYRLEGFNDQFNQQSNVSHPIPTDATKHYARYQVGVSWVVFVGAGDNVLVRFILGDGSVQRSNWVIRDV